MAQWTAANVAGSTKRPFVASLVYFCFSIGSIIGPQTFQDRDAPQYRPAKIAVLATQASCSVTTFLLFLYYVRANRKKRGAIKGEDAYLSREQWVGMTDRKNKYFMYSY